jgi:hypothetical protein
VALMIVDLLKRIIYRMLGKNNKSQSVKKEKWVIYLSTMNERPYVKLQK